MTQALATRGVRAGIDCDPTHGAVAPPIFLSANFNFDGFEGKRRYDYTRSGNPTRDQLGEALASLEGGAGGIVTATGHQITLSAGLIAWAGVVRLKAPDSSATTRNTWIHF